MKLEYILKENEIFNYENSILLKETKNNRYYLYYQNDDLFIAISYNKNNKSINNRNNKTNDTYKYSIKSLDINRNMNLYKINEIDLTKKDILLIKSVIENLLCILKENNFNTKDLININNINLNNLLLKNNINIIDLINIFNLDVYENFYTFNNEIELNFYNEFNNEKRKLIEILLNIKDLYIK